VEAGVADVVEAAGIIPGRVPASFAQTLKLKSITEIPNSFPILSIGKEKFAPAGKLATAPNTNAELPWRSSEHGTWPYSSSRVNRSTNIEPIKTRA
jgi:hypothetical protein